MTTEKYKFYGSLVTERNKTVRWRVKNGRCMHCGTPIWRVGYCSRSCDVDMYYPFMPSEEELEEMEKSDRAECKPST